MLDLNNSTKPVQILTDDIVLLFEVGLSPLQILLFLKDTEVLPMLQLATFFIHPTRDDIPNVSCL